MKMELLTLLIKVAVVVITGYVAPAAKRWLESRAEDARVERLKGWARQAVNAAQQIYKKMGVEDPTGERRRKDAVRFLVETCKRANIQLEETEIDALIDDNMQVDGHTAVTRGDLSDLAHFFPEANIGELQNIENFHQKLRGVLEAPENGYVINSSVLCAADYGAPQKRMRFVVIGIQKNIASKIALPKGHFDEDEYRTVRDAISDLEDIDPRYDLEEDVVGIPLPPKTDLSELGKSLRDSSVLRNHIITRTTETAMERFRALKQGENFHALKDEMKTNTYTDASRTQKTIYLRLEYDEPSGTVVNVRKSMWIHPTRDRAISVREAARLQTFPDSFVFCGTKDKQYQQVGNAVPPILAKAIAKKLAKTLKENLGEGESSGR